MIFGRLKAWLGGLGALILAGLGLHLAGKRRGAEEERQEAKEKDEQRAEDLRDRVERDFVDELQRHADSGWRD